MRTWKESNIIGVLLIIGALVIVWRIGYNMADPDLTWDGYPIPEQAESLPDPVTCTLHEDGSVGCSASLVTEGDWHVGGACLVPEWGCRE